MHSKILALANGRSRGQTGHWGVLLKTLAVANGRLS
jgi:hypothetical protein